MKFKGVPRDLFHCCGSLEWNGIVQYDLHVASFEDEVEEVVSLYNEIYF